ncbi:MAG: serine/threonine-protein kinase [Myxococcales bacterium]
MIPVSPPSKQLGFSYAPGDIIAGKYALEELLGEGGMGAVFRARNTAIDMPVALKLIRADLDREQLSGRLLQEARAAAKLAHPAIVRVFDVGKTALGDPFIVMELLHGESLAALLEREGRMTSVRAVQLLLPIADALSVAHAKGFIHRDVKPDNVFIANDDEGQLQPKLVDFGIVKHERQEGDSQLTQVGAVVGSPDYMSPEQARGLEDVDLRSDVWSFSVVLYEAITGVAPFQATNYNALLRQIVETHPPTLRDLRASDAELSQLIERGLSKSPADRFETMGLMGKALATWLGGQGVTDDACGVSLEARWLSRSSDHTGLGRVSRSSSPDSWPEPPSGIRSVSGKFGNAPTVPLVRAAGTPYSLVSSATALPARKRRWLLGGAGVALLAALLLGYFGVVHASSPASVAGAGQARSQVSAPPSPALERPHRTLAPAPDATEAVVAMASASAAPAAKAVPKATPAKNIAKEPARAPAAADPPSPPKSDLLAPY